MRAATIYSDFPSYSNVSKAFGPAAGPEQLAFSFTPTETATLSDVMLELYEPKGSNPITVAIESNSYYGPGQTLDTLTQGGSANGKVELVTFTCSACSVLDAGSMYWLSVTQTNASTADHWFVSESTTGLEYYSYAPGSWNGISGAASSAFQVDGTTPLAATPEPESMVLCATGLFGLLALGKRRLA